MGDVRAPVIKIIESERRLRNGRINKVTPIHHKLYTNLDYKPILSDNIQNIQVELRNETGKLFFLLAPEKLFKLSLKRTGNSQFKISKYYLKWRSTAAVKHLNQCRIFPDTTDKKAAVLEPLLHVLEELLCHWHAKFSGPQQKRLVAIFWCREHQS